MKILFWILAIASVLAGLFISVVGHFSYGLGLYFGVVGKVACIAGMLSAAVCVICAVLGIIKLRKGDMKKAIVFVVVGLLYCGVTFGGMMLDELVYGIRLENSIEDRKEQMYGEDWNSAPAIEGIPELYQEMLNEVYALVRDENTENLMEFGLVALSEHYGDASLENIGFSLMDLDGDGVDEMLIGTAAPVEEGGTVIAAVYSDPENPFCFPGSYEEEFYYLHAGESEGSYLLENSKTGTVWVIEPSTESILDVSDYQGEALEPSGRLEVEMIPFAQYK